MLEIKPNELPPDDKNKSGTDQSKIEPAVAREGDKNKTVEAAGAKMPSPKMIEFIDWLKKGSRTVHEASQYLGVAKIQVYDFIDELREKYGYDIVEEGGCLVLRCEAIPGQPIKLLPGIKRSNIKIALLAKIGIGLKTFQGTLFKTAIETCKKEQVDFGIIVDLTAGRPGRSDKIDFMERLDEEQTDNASNVDTGDDESEDDGKKGKPKKKKSAPDHYFVDQVNFAVKHLKQLELPFKVFVIAGERDMRHKEKGQNIAAAICQQVPNFFYAGDKEKEFPNDNGNFKLIVADIGASTPYTKSYIAQGTAENYQSAITEINATNRPDVLILAGSHVFCFKPRSTERDKKTEDDNDIDVIQLPSLYGLLPSKKAKKRRGGSHEIGFVILDIEFNEDGSLKVLKVDARFLTAYAKNTDYFEGNHINSEGLTEDEQKIIAHLSEFSRRLGQLSRLLNKPKEQIEQILEKLKQKFPIEQDAGGWIHLRKAWKQTYQALPDNLYINTHKTIDFSDPHIGNKKSIADQALPEIAKEVEIEKPDAVTNSGDTFDGVQNHPGQDQELIDNGADEQVDHGIRIWPRWKVPTYIIRGSSHEAKLLRVGHDMVRYFVDKLRGNEKYEYIEYLGDPKYGNNEEGNLGLVVIKKIKTLLYHPAGGIPFGLSYRLQLVIERMVAKNATHGARRINCGHLHIAFAMVYKGILAIMVPCLEKQTNYLVDRMLIPDLGFWITQVDTDKNDNLTRVVLKYRSFKK